MHNIQATINFKKKDLNEKTKKLGHPISWLVIGDGNSISVYNDSKYLTSSLDWNSGGSTDPMVGGTLPNWNSPQLFQRSEENLFCSLKLQNTFSRDGGHSPPFVGFVFFLFFFLGGGDSHTLMGWGHSSLMYLLFDVVYWFRQPRCFFGI